jgi:hypothetical protein
MPTTKSTLLGADAPRVLSVPMIAAVLANRRKLPARNTLFRWIREQTKNGALRPVTRGLYINQLARPLPTAADAAGFVRGGAIVSLQTVLGEAGVTNNYSDIVTCVVPHNRDHKPSVRPVKAERIEFRFHAMPARFLDEHAGHLEDRLDLDFKYPRATPEKALLDWIYLGASTRTKIAGPPFNIDADRLKKTRLRRLAKAMSLESQLKAYLETKKIYNEHPEVEANDSLLDGGVE